MGGVSVVDEEEVNIGFPGDIPFAVGGAIHVVCYDWSGQGEGYEIQLAD